MKYLSIFLFVALFTINVDAREKGQGAKVYKGNQPEDPFNFRQGHRGNQDRAKQYMRELGYGHLINETTDSKRRTSRAQPRATQ